MKKIITILFMFAAMQINSAIYYLSPTGNDTSGNGSIGSPWLTINKAWTVIAAGDTIFMRGGTYAWNTYQNLISKSGTSGNYIHIFAYQSEKPVITRGTTYNSYSMIYVTGNYLYFKGLEISNILHTSGQSPFGSAFSFLNSSYCIWENINYYNNGAPAILRGSSSNGNLILNCDFHHNYDPWTTPAYGNADGLNVDYSSTTTNANTVRGCRFWNNSDDGIDLWYNDGYVTIDSCWAWNNGYRENVVTTGGDGCGIKLGSNPNLNNTTFKRTVTNCLAFYNRTIGISTNSCPAKMYIYNNTSYGNSVGMYHSESWSDAASVVRNNIFYNNSGGNYYVTWPSATVDHNSWSGYTVTNADFISIDTTGISGARQSDGSLPNINFLKLASNSDLIDGGIDVGITYENTAPDLGYFESVYSPLPPPATATARYIKNLWTGKLINVK